MLDRVLAGAATVLAALTARWLISAGIREWRNAGGRPVSDQLRFGSMDAEMRASFDRGGLFLGLSCAFLALETSAMTVGGDGLADGSGTSGQAAWDMVLLALMGVGLLGFLGCAGLFGLIRYFNWPKFLVPPRHRGDLGAIAGRRYRRRAGIPMDYLPTDTLGRPGAGTPEERDAWDRATARMMPKAVPAGSAVLMVARRPTRGQDALQHYVVVLDGRRAAKVWRGRTAEIPVTPGRHEAFLKVTLAWRKSPVLEIDGRAGEVIRLACEPDRQGMPSFRAVPASRATG